MRNIFRIFGEIFPAARLYMAGALLVLVFTGGFFFDYMFLAGKIMLLFIATAILADFYLLFLTGRELIQVTRESPEKFSNGDDNILSLHIRNNHVFPLKVMIIDELPVQFQVRDFQMKVSLKPAEEKQMEYKLRPVQRGDYQFGKTNVYVTCRIGLISRRYCFNNDPVTIPVYPSFLNIRKYEFLAVSNRLTEAGIKRIRKVGQHSEFDQIREYVRGDDIRSVNWKATAKKAKLMSNQYQEERSQQVYNLIDMGRTMKMPFHEMALLDYAVNSSLVLSNTAVFKHDKTGLITFNTAIDTFMKAERKNNTIARMLEILYNQDTQYAESNYELLYVAIKRLIPQRSLLILYTNFETLASLTRQLPCFQKIARNHLLLVVLFENSEITEFRKKEAKTLEEIYTQTIAEKFIHDKNLIVKALNNHGILSILTRPHDLSVNLINKYLELKDRQLI